MPTTRSQHRANMARMTNDTDASESLDALSTAEVQRRRQSNDQSILLRLPQELRDMVYELVIGGHKKENFIDMTSKEAAPPALTHVCHAIRRETLLIFQGNHFGANLHDFDLQPWHDFYNLACGWASACEPTMGLWFVFRNYVLSTDVALVKSNPLGFLEYGFKHPKDKLLNKQTMLGFGTRYHTRLAHLCEVVRKMAAANMAWDDMKDMISEAADAAMICGELPRGV